MPFTMSNTINLLRKNKKKSATVSFNANYDSQLTVQTTPDGLYNIYTIVGQTGTNTTTLTNWSNKVVTMTISNASNISIYYVCIGGGGYSLSSTPPLRNGLSGGGGAGAYYEGSYNNINGTLTLSLSAAGSGNTSTISSSLGTITAGYGGLSQNSYSGANGINGSSGGGGTNGNAGTIYSPGIGSPPGTNGGTDSNYASGGGGGAGGAGGAGSNPSGVVGQGVGGAGGIGKTPSGPINSIYNYPLCVGGSGTIVGAMGNYSTSYGSGMGGISSYAAGYVQNEYRYGAPGAIIIAVPV